MKRLAIPLVAALLFLGVPAAAEATAPIQEIVSIELIGGEGTTFEVNGRPYLGPLRFTLHADGIAMSETATIEQYLQGISEMPFLWHEEALAAQAIAARTYLTRRLSGGRQGDAASGRTRAESSFPSDLLSPLG